ncbi:unnamed protein product [Nezara viridula]|uniref:Uncharacterized protein n=1 Tax=Nezara viridula TaxID=85310 RepID=A0A9P0E7P8_NEZVI|nr:unnamed protein product [Nezara viridula]
MTSWASLELCEFTRSFWQLHFSSIVNIFSSLNKIFR